MALKLYNCLKPFFVCFYNFDSTHDLRSIYYPASFIWVVLISKPFLHELGNYENDVLSFV